MKKILLSGLMLACSFAIMNANAGEVKGKVVSKKGDLIHVQPMNTTQPTELKLTDQTKYYEKEQKKSANADDVEINEFVEVIYSMDPQTNQPVIDEIIVIDMVD